MILDLSTVLLLLIVSIAVGVVSTTIGVTDMFSGVRQVCHRIHGKLGALLCCPYCLSHWVALAVVIVLRPPLMYHGTHFFWLTVNFICSWFVLVGFNMITILLCLCTLYAIRKYAAFKNDHLMNETLPAEVQR